MTLFRLEASHRNILESVNRILTIHIGLQNEAQSVTKRLNDLELINHANTDLLKETQALFKRVEELELKNQSLRTSETLTPCTHDVSNIHVKLDDFENRSRRSNIIFYGVPDYDKAETWEDCERLVN